MHNRIHNKEGCPLGGLHLGEAKGEMGFRLLGLLGNLVGIVISIIVGIIIQYV